MEEFKEGPNSKFHLKTSFILLQGISYAEKNTKDIKQQIALQDAFLAGAKWYETLVNNITYYNNNEDTSISNTSND